MYSLEDFKEIKAHLDNVLISENGEPVSCKLYSCTNGSRLNYFQLNDGTSGEHCAEACNIADLIQSVDTLLTLPNSSDDCENLSRPLILTLDVLREHLWDAVKGDGSNRYEKRAPDLVISRFANFIKHPREYVMAHHCLAYWEDIDQKSTVVINAKFLEDWDEQIKSSSNKNDARDKLKADLAHKIVELQLPEVEIIKNFLDSCAANVQRMIGEDETPPSSVPLNSSEFLESPHTRQA